VHMHLAAWPECQAVLPPGRGPSGHRQSAPYDMFWQLIDSVRETMQRSKAEAHNRKEARPPNKAVGTAPASLGPSGCSQRQKPGVEASVLGKTPSEAAGNVPPHLSSMALCTVAEEPLVSGAAAPAGRAPERAAAASAEASESQPLLLPGFRPTPGVVMTQVVLNVLIRLNFRLARRDCCHYHAALANLSGVLQNLQACQCNPGFEFLQQRQCARCGVMCEDDDEGVIFGRCDYCGHEYSI